MAIWSHVICESCWEKRNPGRQPVRLRDTEIETCCFCGAPCRSGIYVRESPDNVPHCKCEEK